MSKPHGWMNDDWQEPTTTNGVPHVTKCADCGIEIKLLKDSTEGQRVFCGECWPKRSK